ncbi:Lamin A C [Cichlidogyrus casuarinus]|uniref:Lamin A C n=1 Tax=Cichlidogyrus casuarinus TaxID=1844966 RepID=A0ABD2PY88_9PLAT
MSARSRKAATKSSQESTSTRKSSTATSIKSKPPTTPQHATPIRERSCSPLSISRQDEKDELAYLNDRLAGYIDYVRQLEKDKDRLTKRIKSTTEEQLDKSDVIRKTYDKEVSSLRALVDDLARKTAQLEMEAQNNKDSYKEAKVTAQKLESENASMERTIERLQKELAACKSDPEKYNKLKKDHDGLKKKADSLKSDLDEQILTRTGLENRITSLGEELDLQKRLWKEERESFITKTTYIEEEICSKKTAEYESRLAEELRGIRDKTNQELEDYKLEMEAAFEMKFQQLKANSLDQSGETSRLRQEIMNLRRKFDDANKELAQRISEADLYKRRCSDLDRQLSDERNDFNDQIRHLKHEIEKLNDELQFRLQEFTDLLHAKVSLDQEILVYRKMLEGEESRLQIPTPERASSFSGGPRPGKKRRFVDFDGDLDDTELSGTPLVGYKGKAQFAYQVTSKAVGYLEFDGEQNGKGKWVRLINKSSKSESVDVSNWSLIHSVDGQETTYKFPTQTVIKKGTTCTVWSKDGGGTDNPPKDIVMPINFLGGTNISMRLVDTMGEEHASCCVTKERISRPYGRFSSVQKTGEEKCSLM